MSFAENIKRICAEKGTNLTAVVKAVKGSSSFTTQINHGSLPKEHEMVEMARILGCSVIDFFSDGTTDEITEILDEDEMEILKIFRSLPRRTKHEFMSMVYDVEAKCKLEGNKDDHFAI